MNNPNFQTKNACSPVETLDESSSLKSSKSLTTLTPFLKYFFIFLFFLPVVTFFLGMKYQENKTVEKDYSKTTIPTNSLTPTRKDELIDTNPTTQPVSIKSIQYFEDCKVGIELSSGEAVVIDITDQVISKSCSQLPKPVISADGKYAAFEIRRVTEDPIMKNGASNNTVFVYIASRKNWISVYEYGAAEANKLAISSDNNLSVSLTYEDKPAGTKEFILSEVEKNFEQKN